MDIRLGEYARSQGIGRASIPSCHPHTAEDNPSMDEKAPWAPRRSETEERRRLCELLYDLEIELRKVDWGDPAYIHDEEHDLSRFTACRFAFSREHADWKLLRNRGRISGL